MSLSVTALCAGDRGALARALTLVESTRPDHREQALELLNSLPPRPEPAQRIGITGPPGVGKSTLLESLGLCAVEAGSRVGVLAIDPSSQKSGGSILGDKTRMERLGRHPAAYVRPSPAGGALGGVARRTRESILVLEAAGYDRVLVETVGVGQSEVAVSHLVDTVLLLALPGAGDDLQGMKRGVMETADLLFVNKAETDRLPAARLAANQLSLALRLLSKRTEDWTPPVLLGSGLQSEGIGKLWHSLGEHFRHLLHGDRLLQQRQQQALYWLEQGLGERLLAQFLHAHGPQWAAARERIARGEATPESVLEEFF
jgi:LAO/AO transport system kinase